VLFEANYDEIELQNIVMTSVQWPQHHSVTEKRHLNNGTIFFQLGLLPIKISGYASDLQKNLIWTKPTLIRIILSKCESQFR